KVQSILALLGQTIGTTRQCISTIAAQRSLDSDDLTLLTTHESGHVLCGRRGVPSELALEGRLDPPTALATFISFHVSVSFSVTSWLFFDATGGEMPASTTDLP